jgi:hypothetical protein
VTIPIKKSPVNEKYRIPAVSNTVADIHALAIEMATGLNGHCCTAWKTDVNIKPPMNDAKTKYPVMDSLFAV